MWRIRMKMRRSVWEEMENLFVLTNFPQQILSYHGEIQAHVESVIKALSYPNIIHVKCFGCEEQIPCLSISWGRESERGEGAVSVYNSSLHLHFISVSQLRTRAAEQL